MTGLSFFPHEAIYKFVAYYRTRPADMDASDVGLQLQQDAVRDMLAESGMTLVDEFTELEGEDDGLFPAYRAAVAVASAGKDDGVALLIASHSPIGSGKRFREPEIADVSFYTHHLDAVLVPTLSKLALPPDAPASLCLYALVRPHAGDTLIYLCNAHQQRMADLSLIIDSIDMSSFYQWSQDERWTTCNCTSKKNITEIEPGFCSLINILDHRFWDFVNRYRLSYRDCSENCWLAEFDDLSLNACRLSDDPDAIWVSVTEFCANPHVEDG